MSDKNNAYPGTEREHAKRMEEREQEKNKDRGRKPNQQNRLKDQEKRS